MKSVLTEELELAYQSLVCRYGKSKDEFAQKAIMELAALVQESNENDKKSAKS